MFKEENDMILLPDNIRRGLLPALIVVAANFAGASAFAQNCEIKIGAAGPYSGGAAAWGLAYKAGPELVAALYNEKGGLPMGDKKCPVKIVSFDSQYTAAGGSAAGNFFASEDVHAVVGPLGSPEHTGFKAVAMRNKIVNFTPTYAVDAIGPEFPFAFKASQAPFAWSPVLIKAAKDRFNHKSIVLIGPNDQGGTDGTRQLQKVYADQGFTTSEEYYQRGTTNFAPLATRIMSLNADAIEVSTVPPVDQTILFKQLIEAGWNGVIGSMGGGGEKPIIEGADSAKHIKGAYWLEVMDTEQPGATKLNEEWRRLMKSEPPVNSLFLVGTNSAEILLKAISVAGTDKDGSKIREALLSTPPESQFFGKEGWRGKTQFKSNQELAFPVGLGIYQDGKRVGVKGIPVPTE